MNPHPTIKLPVAELKTAIGGLTKVIPRHSTLPVLGMIHVERDRQGWVHLTGTDLDTFLSLRLEAPQQIGDPAKCLVPFAELQKLGKTCPADEVLDLEVLSEDKLLLRHRIGSHPVEQVITVRPVGTSPSRRRSPLRPSAWMKPPAARLLEALACASDDETRVILNGAYLDVSKPTGHYAVATDGRHLFASNSLHLALPSSVLIPDHRFLSWSGFVKDGQWKLAVQHPRRTRAATCVWKAAAGRSSPSRSRARTRTGAPSPTMCASLAAISRSTIRRRKRSIESCPGCRETTRPITRSVCTACRAGSTCAAQQGPGTRHRSRGARRHRQR